ncbi:MAG: cytidylate kinase [Pedosphaera sp.]|nr:MAG: cytidylate kinase [Pedosphaera sp.]
MPHTKPYVIAIDGPSASGKGVTSRRLAQMLGVLTVDTGAMYRTLAWHCLRMKVDVNEDKKVAALCRKWKTSLVVADAHVRLLVDGYYPAQEIRTSEASAAVAHVAQIRFVRDWMKAKQRECLQFGSCVMEGRDIGSNIFPETDYKFFLDASPEVRKTRREREGVTENLHDRDKRDSSRAHSPLMPSLGAKLIDNSHQGVQETCDIMLDEINVRREANRLVLLKPVA